MFIAFEGPDNTGKTTSASSLASDNVALYNATRTMHREMQEDQAVWGEPDAVVTYDRIDWFSHMVYRLSLPDRDWNDDRPRTVFAMPDTHLVVKLHRPDLADFIVPADGEDAATNSRTRGVETKISQVNPMYYYFAKFMMELNETREYALFKSVSIIEVANDPRDGTFTEHLRMFSSPVTEDLELPLPINDQLLLDLLRDDDHRR